MKRLMIAALLAASAPVAAQTAPAAPVTAPADPARLAVATRVVARLMPNGTYRKMMGPMIESMSGSMRSQMLDFPIRKFLEDAGLPAEDTRKLGPGTFKEVIAILDPAFDQRMEITMRVVSGGMIDMLSDREPALRTVFADVYARHFSLQQLNDLDAFFRTPSGSYYAEHLMMLASDPAIADQMKAMMPDILKLMPSLVRRANEATASLPKAKEIKNLTPAEKARLEKLLGPMNKEAAK